MLPAQGKQHCQWEKKKNLRMACLALIALLEQGACATGTTTPRRLVLLCFDWFLKSKVETSYSCQFLSDRALVINLIVNQ